MNQSVSHYIAELLFLHDCVIVPEFGGFVGNRKSAQLNKKTGALIPPSKQILFNPHLKTNDGLLSSYIANQEGISQEIALNNVLDYSTEKSDKLSSSKILRLDKVGLFTLGKEGNVIFLQASLTNYNLDSFGMKATYNKAVKRKTETEKQVEVTVQTIRRKSRKPKALLRAVAVIIPLVALSFLSISQQERINNVYTQMATLNPFATTETIIEVFEVINEKDLIFEVANEIIETAIVKEVETPVFTEQKTYYIIAGAFAEQKNANKMLNKLNRWNYNAEIVEGENLLRVSYDSFVNRADAVLALNKIKQENSDAWLLTE